MDGISKFYDPEELEAKNDGHSEYIFQQYVPVKISSAEELLSKKSEIENALGDWLNYSSEVSVTDNPVIIDYVKETAQGPMILFKANLKVTKGISLEQVQNQLENAPIRTNLISGFQTDLTGLTRIIRQEDGTVGVLSSNGTVKSIDQDILNGFSSENATKKIEEMASEEVRKQEEVTRMQEAAEVQLQIEVEQQEAKQLKEQEEKIAIQEENLHRLEEFVKAQNEERSEESLVLFEGNFITTLLDSSSFISSLNLIQEEVRTEMKIEETDDIKVNFWFSRQSATENANEEEKCWIPFELGESWSSHAEGLHSTSSRFEVMYRVVGKKDQKVDFEIGSAEVDSRIEKFIAKHTPGRGSTSTTKLSYFFDFQGITPGIRIPVHPSCRFI